MGEIECQSPRSGPTLQPLELHADGSALSPAAAIKEDNEEDEKTIIIHTPPPGEAAELAAKDADEVEETPRPPPTTKPSTLDAPHELKPAAQENPSDAAAEAVEGGEGRVTADDS